MSTCTFAWRRERECKVIFVVSSQTAGALTWRLQTGGSAFENDGSVFANVWFVAKTQDFGSLHTDLANELSHNVFTPQSSF